MKNCSQDAKERTRGKHVHDAPIDKQNRNFQQNKNLNNKANDHCCNKTDSSNLVAAIFLATLSLII